MEVVRNLGRRRLRNLLTMGGITIGVLALTTMGALAEKSNSLLDGGVRFFSDHIAVADASNQFGTSLIDIGKADRIQAVAGVAGAYPTITLPARGDPGGFRGPLLITAVQPAEAAHLHFKLALAEGRGLDPAGRSEVVLGADLARQLRVGTGATVTLPVPAKEVGAGPAGHRFRVVGLLAKTLTVPDGFAEVGFPDAQQILAESLPASLRGSLEPSRLATGIDVFGGPHVDLDGLARRLQLDVPGIRATPPGDLVKRFRQAGALFSAITTGSALLAVLVGGLSVVNTMVMAVSERVREIGLKKAVGAHTRDILGEYILEATLIGVLGGGAGLLLGWLVTLTINLYTQAQDVTLFLLTPRLALFAILFSVGLGAGAGVLPALRAARLDPVAALRSP